MIKNVFVMVDILRSNDGGEVVLDYTFTFRSYVNYFADPNPLDFDHEHDASGDGISDADTYWLSSDPSIDGRVHPLRKDVFVEVDWMEGHRMMDAAKWKVGTRFYEHDIWLHIDDGKLGGGGEVRHCNGDTITFGERGGNYNDFNDYYGNNNYFSIDREDRFHYCLMADLVTSNGDNVGGVANGPYGGHFTVADGEWDNNVESGSTFMHELGHTLGLHSWDFDGVDSERYSFDKYPSVMNYNAPDDYYDYSSGPDSGTNNDDWSEVINDMGEYL